MPKNYVIYVLFNWFLNCRAFPWRSGERTPRVFLECRGDNPRVFHECRRDNPRVFPEYRGDNPRVFPEYRGDDLRVFPGAGEITRSIPQMQGR